MSTVKPGDLVRFIDEVGEGRVTRLLSSEMAEVKTNDGWLLPAYIRTLVVIPENREELVKPAKTADIGSVILQKEVIGQKINKVPESKPSNLRIPPREIDLHINKLLDQFIGMTNTEILTVQLDVFRKELKQAIQKNEREIIFIHGIGNGTLKLELRRVADQEFGWCQQEDASFKEYGFGATRIRIPQNKPF